MTGQQLRNSILQEAIQGRLVPNVLESGEKTGSELLQLILDARQRTENKERGNKAKKLTLSTIEEEPWELPKEWCWARLGDIVDHRGGLWEGKKPPLIRIGVIRNANFTKKFTLSFDNIAYLNVEEKQFLSRRLEFGDIIIEKSGGGENQPVGRPVLFLKTDGDFSFSNFTQMIRIADKEIVLPSFLQQVLVAFYVSGETVKLQSNTTNLRNLDFKGYLDLFVPLPPLSIQKAIVAKIEELLPLVDEYDKAAGELETLNKILPDKLRKSVLQEAIHGNLVPNDIPEGEATGAELLQQILKERQERENKEKGKRAKILTLSTIEDEPWELPEGWCWCKLKDIGICETGTTPSKAHPEYFGGETPFYSPGNILNNVIVGDTIGISDEGIEYCRVVEPNTILQVCIGGSIGKCAIVHKRSAFNQQINSISPIISDYKYVYYVLQTDYFYLMMKDLATGTATPIINRGNWEQILVPLPPLSTQHRIVEKIEEVFSAIERLC